MSKEMGGLPFAAEHEEALEKEHPPEEERAAEEETARRKRGLALEKEKNWFRYGELAPDHPAQAYVTRLAKRLERAEGPPFHVFILPDWMDVNAEAFSDGTVFVSRALIEEVESEEALLGIIAHEYVHILREHGEQRTIPTTVAGALEELGRRRGQEYEADLRGTIELLETHGINPIGYKTFLEKLHRKEESKQTGIIHGSSLDRALNIATATHLVDLKSITADLHPIPDEIVQSLKETRGKRSHLNIALRPASDTRETRKESRVARREQVTRLEPRELPLAIRATFEHVAQGERSEKPDPDDETTLAGLIERYEREQIHPRFRAEDQRMAAIIGLQLFAGMPILQKQMQYGRPKPKYLKPLEDEAAQLMKTEEQCERLRAFIAARLPDFHEPYFRADVASLGTAVADVAIQGKWFGDFKGKNPDIEAFRGFALRWAETLAAANRAFGTEEALDAREIERGIGQQAWNAAGVKKVRQRIRNAFALNAPRKEKARVYEKNEFTEDGARLGERLASPQFRRELDAYRRELLERLAGKPLVEVGAAITSIHNGLETYRLFEAKRVSPLFENASGPIAMRLFRSCLERLPQFKDMPRREKQLVVLSAGLRLGLLQNKDDLETKGIEIKKLKKRRAEPAEPEESADAAYDDTFDEDALDEDEEYEPPKWKPEDSPKRISPRVRAELEQRLADACAGTNSDFLLKAPFTKDEFVRTYRYLADNAFYDANVGLREIATPESIGGEFHAEALAVSYLGGLWAERTFPEIAGDIAAWRGEGVDVRLLLARHQTKCGPLLARLAETLERGEAARISFGELVDASAWIPNPLFSQLLARYARELHWPRLSFDEKLKTAFPVTPEDGPGDLHVQETFMEQEMRTKEHAEGVRKRIGESIEEILGTGRREAGVAAIASTFTFRFHDVNSAIRALMESDKNERVLKTLIYELIREPYGLTYGAEDEEIEGEEKRKAAAELRQSLRNADGIIRGIYTLDDFGRQILLRKLLTSAGGALPTQEKRESFLRFLMRDWIEPDPAQNDVVQILDAVREALTEVKEWQLLYFAFQSVLRDKIGIPPSPEKTVPWSRIYAVEDDLVRNGILEAHTEGGYATEKTYFEKNQQRKMDRFFKTALWDAVPPPAIRKPWRYEEEYRHYADQRLRTAFDALGMRQTAATERITPIRFVKEVASRLGAPGVRFLQLLPQFVALPKEYEQEFSEVYDAVKGQVKLSAITLLEREWPELWQTIDAIGERVGGGSIMTVYRARARSGEDEVIKVRNPNIQYHLNETYRFASVVLGILKTRRGGAYAAAESALQDIKRWIEADIGFEGFLEDDARFRSVHNGFRAGANPYRIRIPQSKGPENSYFMREEYIEGKNLTKWDELVAEGHDIKQVVSLLAKNYLAQIRNGLVHSDVHVGNFRITPQKEIAVLDRNFYLKLSEAEQQLIAAIANPFAPTAIKKERLQAYLGMPTALDARERASGLLDGLVNDMSAGRWESIGASLVALKQSGVTVPLTFTLLLKNFNSLQVMARRAGFRNVIETVLYSA